MKKIIFFLFLVILITGCKQKLPATTQNEFQQTITIVDDLAKAPSQVTTPQKTEKAVQNLTNESNS